MKKSHLLLKAILCLFLARFYAADAVAQGWKIEKTLAMELENSPDAARLHPIVVIMEKQYEQLDMNIKTQFMDNKTRREFVINEMKKFTEKFQYDVITTLGGNVKDGTVKSLRSFWAFNGFSCSATADVINMLAMRHDVKLIISDIEQNMLPEKWDPRPAGDVRGNAWNIDKVHAPEVWNFNGESGYTGNGVIVAVIDTGVNYNHGDIADNMWDGDASYPHHGYDFVNNDNDPIDDHGHGTHCAGTVAGYGTNGTHTGVAPGAKIMALKALDAAGNCTSENVIRAMQFAIEHNADVMSMSLGSHGGGYYLYRQVLETALAAGIPAAVAAGNDGDNLGAYPIPYNITSPGNCPPPYLHPDQAILSGGLSAVICTGATDVNDSRMYFTAAGPATWTAGEFHGDYNDYPYVPGSSTAIGLIRPDVAAPGQNITSLAYDSNTGYTIMDGTSMATPCNAGVIALLLEANPGLTPAEIDYILETTAVKCDGSTSKSNHTGSGRIDALAAVSNALTSCDAPANLNAVHNESTVALTWTAASNVASYNIYCNSELLVENYTSVSYLMYDVSFPGNYTYYVKSNCLNGTSSLMSNTATISYNNVVCSTIPNAVITANKSMADAGTTVSVTVTPEAGYALNTVFYTKEDGSIVNINTETMQFTMPSCSVTISATLNEQQFVVSAELDDNEKVKVSWNGSASAVYDLVRAKTNASGTTAAGVETIATNVTGGHYTDNKFNNAGDGYYKWGLKPKSKGNRQEIIIGNGTEQKNQVPFNTVADYSLSQQIYKSNEIKATGNITGNISSIGFNISQTYSGSRNITVYMKCSETETFANGTSWVSLTSNDEVFKGIVNISNTGWLTINLSKPFDYQGGNLMICVDDNTCSAVGSCLFNTTNVPNSAIYYYCYSFLGNPNPLSPPTGTLFSYRPNLKIEIESTPEEIFWSNPVEKVSSSNINFFVNINENNHADNAKIYLNNISNPQYSYTATTNASGSATIKARNGSYNYLIRKSGYNEYKGTVTAPGGIEVTLEEENSVPQNLFVSNTGWATWDSYTGGDKSPKYYKVRSDMDDDYVIVKTPYYQYDETLDENKEYCAYVKAVYEGDVESFVSTYWWTYKYCSHYNGISNLLAEISGGEICLDWTLPEPYANQPILGTMVWRGDSLLTPTPLASTATSYIDNGFGASGNATYSVRVVYDKIKGTENDGYNSMSCPKSIIPKNAYHWNTNTQQYSANMTVTAIIKVDDIIQNASNLEVGAFCGNECRGTKRAKYHPECGLFIAIFNVYGENDDLIKFKLYDHNQGEELKYKCTSHFDFEANTTQGSTDDPYEIKFFSAVTQNSELAKNNNWYSSYVTLDGKAGLQLMETGLETSASNIKSQNGYTTFVNNNSWFGSLTEANNREMYVINMTSAKTFSLRGPSVETSEVPITTHQGWNWIGYPVEKELNVNTALASLNPSVGDKIKSQSQQSEYGASGWTGELTTMKPGQGYMYYQNAAGTQVIIYNADKSSDKSLNDNIKYRHWDPDIHKYAMNMSVTAAIAIDGEIQSSENLEVGAFCNGEVRGSASPIYYEPLGTYIVMLTVHGEDSDNIVFKLYDSGNGAEYKLFSKETLRYTDNDIVGSLSEPYTINFGNSNESGSVNFYPNPTERGKEISLPFVSEKVEIFNAIGIKMAEYQNVSKINGIDASGTYIIRVTDGANVRYGKLIVE